MTMIIIIVHVNTGRRNVSNHSLKNTITDSVNQCIKHFQLQKMSNSEGKR